jgi:hypothetical protein
MNKCIIKYKNIASIIVIAMILLAIPSGVWPYGYYLFLRWVVTGIALFVLWAAYELEKKTWLWIMGVIAVLFNPIAPIHLDKGTWVVIDFIAAIIFIVSIFKIKVPNNNL